MINVFRFILLVLVFILFADLNAQILHKNLNKLDEDGKRKGLWISYWDEEEKVPMSVARYKKGREVGVSKEYHMNGNLRLKFRYGEERIRVKYYDEDRRLEQKGWAILDYNEVDTHYYWHGEWKYFNNKRKLQKVKYYQHGEEISQVDIR